MTLQISHGFLGHFGFGEESAYGTAVARSYWYEILGESIQKMEERLESASLFRRGILNTKVAQGAKFIDGSVEFEAQFGGWLKLAKHAFGQIDTTNPDPTNAPTAKQHKFSIANSLPTGLTMEVYRGTESFVTEASKAFLYTGMKVNSMTFSAAVNEILKVSCALMGQDESRVAKGTPSFSSDKLAVYHQGNLTFGGRPIDIEEFSISLNNGLEMRPKFGARTTREPSIASKVEVSGSFTCEFSGWNEYDDFINATDRALDIQFEGDNIGAAIYKRIRLLCNVAKLTDVRVVLDTVGRLRIEQSFKAYRTESLNELELYVTNTETGI